MKLVSNKDIEKIFLTSNTKIKNLSTKIDIIVSPEFYWTRKIEIPVKTVAQAREVLPSFFEDIIDEVSNLTYQVIRLEENLFLCFAFSNKKIYEAIKGSNIPIPNISSLYFAQNECKKFDYFKIDGQNFMYTSDGILIKIPPSLASGAIDLKKVLKDIKLSSHRLQMKLYNAVLSTKVYYNFFVILAILTLVNFTKYLSYSFEVDKDINSIEKLKTQNSLPQSTIAANAIVNKYNEAINKQKSKREAISYIFSNKKLNLKGFTYAKEILHLEYSFSDKNKAEEFLKKRFKILSSQKDSSSLKVSIKI